jgi:tetratricopeptide (TPR) repeat protein
MSIDQLETELTNYVQLHAWRIARYELPSAVTPASLTSRRLTEAEAEVYLAGLFLEPFIFRAAEKHVQKALKLEPDNPSVRAVKGMLHLFKSERSEGLQECARALSGSEDLLIPDVHFYYANALRQSDQPADVEKQRLVVKHLQKTIELNPGLGEAYLILAQTDGLAGAELDTTISALGRLVRVATWRHDLTIALARLYGRKGDEARCRRLLESVVNSRTATESAKSQAAAMLRESAP